MPTLIDPASLSLFAESWSDQLIQVSWKASLLLVATATTLVLIRRTSAATRHMLWTVSMVGVLLLPLLSAALPSWTLPLPTPLPFERPAVALGIEPTTTMGGTAPSSGQTNQPATQDLMSARDPLERPSHNDPRLSTVLRGLSISSWLFLLWELGVLLVALRIGMQAVRLQRLKRGALPITDHKLLTTFEQLLDEWRIDRPVDLLRSGEVGTPLTWGLRRSFVLLPAGCEWWNAGKARHVLTHELAHVARHDCLSQSLAQVACALHWFNPLVWIAAGRMHMEREKACDDRVLESGAKPSSYANDLVEIACSHGHEPAPAMAKRSQISHRVTALLDEHQRRRSPGKRVVVTLTSLVAGAALLLSALSFAAPTPEPQSSRQDRDTAELTGAEAEIAAANAAFMKAFEAGDIDAMLTHWTEDAEVYMAFGQPLRGRRDLRDHYEELLDSDLVYEVEAETEHLEVYGDKAYETGHYSAYGYSGKRISKGTYMSVWTKDGGSWRVAREIVSVASQDLSSEHDRDRRRDRRHQ